MNTIRVGFVPSYRFGTSEWVQKMRSDSLAMFAQVEGMQVIVPQPPAPGQTPDPALGITQDGMVRTLEEGIALGEFFRREQVDALIICPLDFGDERSSGKIAEMLGVPVLLYATKEPEAPKNLMMSRHSDSYCGNLSTAAALLRRKIPFRYAGLFFPGEPQLLEEVRTFVSAVAVVKALRGAQIGQVGLRPATFETVAYDEIAMARKFGMNVIHAELSEMTDRAQALKNDDPAVKAKVAEIMGSVDEVTVAPDHVYNAARFQLTLEDFFRRNHLSAAGIQCWPAIQRLMKLSVCALYGRLTEQGMLTACETDILGSLSMIANSAAALGKVPPHFIDWTIQHRDDPNKLLAWHCGNAPASLASEGKKSALRSRYDMTGTAPVEEGDNQAGLYQFQLRPGTVTFCRLAEYDGEWKMLIATGEIIPSDETLAGTWSWVQVRDHEKLYRTLVEEGFIHHASMIHGDQKAALALACKYLDIQAVIVD